jgi:hypothetical protein
LIFIADPFKFFFGKEINMAAKETQPKNALLPLPIIGIESAIESAPDQSTEGRACRIAEAAYYKAQARGFEPGHEMEDWLAAEAEAMR